MASFTIVTALPTPGPKRDLSGEYLLKGKGSVSGHPKSNSPPHVFAICRSEIYGLLVGLLRSCASTSFICLAYNVMLEFLLS